MWVSHDQQHHFNTKFLESSRALFKVQGIALFSFLWLPCEFFKPPTSFPRKARDEGTEYALQCGNPPLWMVSKRYLYLSRLDRRTSNSDDIYFAFSQFWTSCNWQIKYVPYTTFVGRDSAVGIATRYGLDGPGIESRRGKGLPRSRPALGPTQPPVDLFPGGKAAVAWRWPPTHH